MGLSQYKNQDNLNAGVWRNRHTNYTQAALEKGQDFDKRYASQETSSLQQLSSFIDNMEGWANALGTRSPYYTIGEVQDTIVGQKASRYLPNGLGNMVRAITSTIDWLTGNDQSGVIIDGFNSVSGDIAVEFAKNPVIFVSSQVTDSRMRTPNTLTMTVYVSNYNNDNYFGTWLDRKTAERDSTGILSSVVDLVLTNGNTRAQQALYKLREIQERGKPFTVYTPHGVYENMMIKSLKPKTNADNVDMLECDITFTELIMYEPYKATQTTSMPARTNVGDSSLVANLMEETQDLAGKGGWRTTVNNFMQSNWISRQNSAFSGWRA